MMDLNTLFIHEGISLQSSLDFVSDGIIVVNKDLRILYINKSGREICGVIPEGEYTCWPDTVGVYERMDTGSIYDPEKLPLVRALKGEIVIDARLYLNNSILNSWRCISCNSSAIKKDDEIVGAILSFRDITVRLQLNELNRQKEKALEEEKARINKASKLTALGFLAAELGHEINNPLAIIRSSSWILRKILTAKEIKTDMALDKLDEIDLTIQRISDTVTSVKNLSSNSSREKMDNYVLGDILRDVKNICGPRLNPKGMELRLNMKNPLLKERIYCSRIQISEVLINLLVNAIDSIETANSHWIQIDVFKEDHLLKVRFTDSGPGVPSELAEKIFTPFFSTKSEEKGTGLGLSISKKIMQRHGGDLLLNREISGSCFEAILPLQ